MQEERDRLVKDLSSARKRVEELLSYKRSASIPLQLLHCLLTCSTSSSVCSSVCVQIILMYYVCPSVCLSVCLSVCPSICVSVHLCVSVCLSVHPSVCLSVFKHRMKEVLNQDPGEVAGMLKDPCYTRKELAKVLVTTKRKLEEAQQSRDAAWKDAVEAKDKVGFLQCCLCSFCLPLQSVACKVLLELCAFVHCHY